MQDFGNALNGHNLFVIFWCGGVYLGLVDISAEMVSHIISDPDLDLEKHNEIQHIFWARHAQSVSLGRSGES